MNIKRMLFLTIICFVISVFLAHNGWTQQMRPQSGTIAPVITNSYMIDKGQYGKVLKIYLEAEDPDGEMHKIVTSVDQVGYGHYPTDFIILKAPYQKSFKGYIQWNTFSSKTFSLDEWTRITIKVSVIDKAGNMSNEVMFPFTFETGAGGEPKLPAPFDQGDLSKLGKVSIDLYNPFRMDGGEGNFD